MTITKNHIIAVLVIAVMLFIFFNIWEKHPSVVDSHVKEVDSLEQQIAVWDSLAHQHMLINDSLRAQVDSLHKENDSIASSKIKVKHIYHEIYKDINTASNTQLDSIIRSNWE
jgi:hypothetical protein